tara:strand:+ start:175 stop:741 length:567 start_codon:yes stop_codon:yes gene_type:complete
MPNWCRNELTITGDKDIIKELTTVITNEDGTYSLTNTMPTPKEFDGIHSGSITIDDIRYSNWYEDENGTRTPVMDMTMDSLKEKYNCNNSIDWQYLNWGTKWGDLETTVTINDDNSLSITFDSAWGEPFMLLQHIAEMYKVEIVNKYLDEFEYDLPEPHRSEYPMEDFNQVESYHTDSFTQLIEKYNR